MFERFTDRARRVVVLAQEEARLLNHNYIGTEHILLGLIHEGEGVAAKALESLGISLEAVRNQVEEIIGQGGSSPSGHIPFTPRAKKVLELSLREALQLGHTTTGKTVILQTYTSKRKPMREFCLDRMAMTFCAWKNCYAMNLLTSLIEKYGIDSLAGSKVSDRKRDKVKLLHGVQ